MAIVIAMLGATAVIRIVAVFGVAAVWLLIRSNEQQQATYFFVPPILMLVLVGFCFALFRWKELLWAEERPWFCRWPMRRMAGLVLVLLALGWALPLVGIESAHGWPNETYGERLVFFSVRWLFPVASCLTWLWWMDAGSKRLTDALAQGAFWVMFQCVLFLHPVDSYLMLGLGPDSSEASYRLAYSGSVFGEGFTLFANNAWRGLSLRSVTQNVAGDVIRAVGCSLAIWVAFRAWRWESGALGIANDEP